MNKYVVQAGYMTKHIYVGRANRAGNAFVDKETATDMVLAAVAQYVMRNFEGGMATTFPRLGLALQVKVRPIKESEPESDPEVSGNEIGDKQP